MSVDVFQSISQSSVLTDPSEPDILESNHLPYDLLLQEVNVLNYIAGYICHRLCSSVSCVLCSTLFNSSVDQDSPSHLLIRQKQYDINSHKGLVYPTKSLSKIIEIAEKVYNLECDKHLHICKIKQNIFNKVKANTSLSGFILCSC